MKKLISIILAVFIFITAFMTIPVCAKNPVELKIADVTVYAGDEFQVKVFISDNSKLSGAVVDLEYDADALEFVSGNTGGIVDESSTVSIKNLENRSRVRFTYMSGSSSVVSAGVLFTVTFKALKTADGTSDIKLSIPNSKDFIDSNLQPVEYKLVNARVRVINETYSETESTSETEATTESTLASTETTTTEPATVDNTDNESDKDNYKLSIGLIVAGAVIIIGAIIYAVSNKRKKR